MSKTLSPTTASPSSDLIPSPAPAASDVSSSVASVASGATVTPTTSLQLQPGLGNAGIQALLTDQGWLDTVSSAEAATALDQLLALPPEARGQAVDGLDDSAFQALTASLPDGELSQMQEAITHELGHAAHLGNPDFLPELEAVAGWTHLGAEGLADWAEQQCGQRPTDKEMATLDATRSATSRTDPVCSDDWCYGVDPYDGDGYLVRQRESIPDYDETLPMANEEEQPCPTGTPSWDYARTSPEDHFAELYVKAIQQPEALYRDLVLEPQSAVKAKQSELSMTNYWLQTYTEAGLDEAKIAEQRAKVAEAEADLARLQVAAKAQAGEWDLMKKVLAGGSSTGTSPTELAQDQHPTAETL